MSSVEFSAGESFKQAEHYEFKRNHIEFNGLKLRQDAIDDLDIEEIQSLKKHGLEESTGMATAVLTRVLQVSAVVGGGLMAIVKGFSGDYTGAVHSLSMGAGGLALAYYITSTEKAKKENLQALDLLEYMKSGDITNIAYADTPKKAAETNLRIGPAVARPV